MFPKSCLQTLSMQAWGVACMWVHLKSKFEQVLHAENMKKLYLSFKCGSLDEAFLEKYRAGAPLEYIKVEDFTFMQQHGVKALNVLSEIQFSRNNVSKTVVFHEHVAGLRLQFALSYLPHALTDVEFDFSLLCHTFHVH